MQFIGNFKKIFFCFALYWPGNGVSHFARLIARLVPSGLTHSLKLSEISILDATNSRNFAQWTVLPDWCSSTALNVFDRFLVACECKRHSCHRTSHKWIFRLIKKLSRILILKWMNKFYFPKIDLHRFINLKLLRFSIGFKVPWTCRWHINEIRYKNIPSITLSVPNVWYHHRQPSLKINNEITHRNWQQNIFMQSI